MMAIRAVKPTDKDWFVPTSSPEECHYCGEEFTRGYANMCITVCERCASRRRLPVVAHTENLENAAG